MGQRAGLSTQRGRIRLGVSVKVAALLLATLLVTLTLPTFLSLHDQGQELYAEHDRRGHEIARLMARLLSDRVAGNNTRDLDALLQDLIRQPDIVYARIESSSGGTLATAGVSPGDTARIPSFHEDIHANGVLIGRVVLGLSTEQVIQTLMQRQRQALWGQGLVILSVLMVGLMAMSTLIGRPIAVISGALRANTRSDQNRIDHVPLHGNDEFGELAQEFNVLGKRMNETQQTLESRVAATDQELLNAYRRLEVQTEELRELNRQLEQRNLTDPLTGLYNHRYFETLMDTEVERCVRNDETISILLVEVNNLPARIEQAGNHGGDELIRGIAQVVANHTRTSDVACRYGSCGFFMLCRRATIANAVALADDLQRDLAEHSFMIHGQPQHLTASIGVATIPGVHRVASAANLLECADEALRHSHQTGHAVVHYSMLERQARPVAL